MSSLNYSACIGNGSFGLVFAATDPATNSSSAVKVLFPESDAEGGEVEETQIRRECTITANLDEHENVVKIISVTEKQLSLAEMEQLLPENLFETKEQTKLEQV